MGLLKMFVGTQLETDQGSGPLAKTSKGAGIKGLVYLERAALHSGLSHRWERETINWVSLTHLVKFPLCGVESCRECFHEEWR